MPDFTNRVFLIAGATGGLGGAVTRAFLDAGALVAGVSSRPGGIVHERYLAVQADVTTTGGARSAVQQALAKWSRLDALVHLVGGFAGGRPVAQTDDETWRRMIGLNLDAAFYMARAANCPAVVIPIFVHVASEHSVRGWTHAVPNGGERVEGLGV